MMSNTKRAIALVAAAIAITGFTAAPSQAAKQPKASPAAQAPIAPLNINGRHVFWANGVRSVANSDPSSATNNLIYHGGAIQKMPKVYVTFWGKEWTDKNDPSFIVGGATPVKDPNGKPYTLARLQAYVTAFFKGLGGSPWNNIETQFCQGGQIGDLSCAAKSDSITNTRTVLAGVWNDTSAADAPAPVIDTLGLAENLVTDPVATEAVQASKHFNTTDTDATFFVFAPPGRVVTGSQPFGAYCGYHSEVTPTDGSPHGLRYAFIPYILDADFSPTSAVAGCGLNYVNAKNTTFGNGIFDGFSVVSGHEFSEAATDPDSFPFQDGWNDIQTSENGDKCAWRAPGSGQEGETQNVKLRTGVFAMQSMWSNADNAGAGGCVLAYKSPR
jgi:hypothetical protein